MSKILVCNWCKNPISEGLYKNHYRIKVYKRFWGYSGFDLPHRVNQKLDICNACKNGIIVMTEGDSDD